MRGVPPPADGCCVVAGDDAPQDACSLRRALVTHSVLELVGAVGSLRQVVDGEAVGVTRVQERSDVINVILDGGLDPFSREGHD